jgi:spore coat polysaccharide biosynthesis protein SpsF (cytidylyltransferase family)
MLYHAVARARQARTLSLVTVATTSEPGDEVIEAYCQTEQVLCFRGSEADVLDRYYRAANHFSADVVVRLTSDCPLLDPAVIDEVVGRFLGGQFDFVSNVHPPTYPDGLDSEVCSREALGRAWREARLTSEREHVTSYIKQHPELFRLANVEHEPDLSHLRWTVDEPQDLEFVRRVYRHFAAQRGFGMNEIVALLREDPQLSTVNAGLARNEGYLKSLRADGIEMRKSQ